MNMSIDTIPDINDLKEIYKESVPPSPAELCNAYIKSRGTASLEEKKSRLSYILNTSTDRNLSKAEALYLRSFAEVEILRLEKEKNMKTQRELVDGIWQNRKIPNVGMDLVTVKICTQEITEQYKSIMNSTANPIEKYGKAVKMTDKYISMVDNIRTTNPFDAVKFNTFIELCSKAEQVEATIMDTMLGKKSYVDLGIQVIREEAIKRRKDQIDLMSIDKNYFRVFLEDDKAKHTKTSTQTTNPVSTQQSTAKQQTTHTIQPKHPTINRNAGITKSLFPPIYNNGYSTQNTMNGTHQQRQYTQNTHNTFAQLQTKGNSTSANIFPTIKNSSNTKHR